jgi:hypothetical protein
VPTLLPRSVSPSLVSRPRVLSPVLSSSVSRLRLLVTRSHSVFRPRAFHGLFGLVLAFIRSCFSGRSSSRSLGRSSSRFAESLVLARVLSLSSSRFPGRRQSLVVSLSPSVTRPSVPRLRSRPRNSTSSFSPSGRRLQSLALSQSVVLALSRVAHCLALALDNVGDTTLQEAFCLLVS